ncbi:MAG: hypothetical protein HC882_03355 [Acidobacteria bacterium]|nr:hypothetical protein [Acidobacteriota bacterium]
MPKTYLLLLLTSALVLGGVSCNSNDGEDTASGVVSLYASNSGPAAPPAPAAGSLTSVVVTFSSLSLYNTLGQAVALATDTNVDIDLLASFSDANSLVGTFQVPAGDYNGVAGRIQLISVTDGDTGFTCSAGGSISIPRITLSQPFLTVRDDGTAAFLVELPVTGGSCNIQGGQGTITLGTPSVIALPLS